MSKVELLAPAGSKEALIAAVQSGCDAVYLGGNAFGARAFAQNFDDELMGWAIAYCHRYGVSVYVTVNTLIKDEEIHDCLVYIEKLQALDVDALIIQDLGLLDLIHQRFPDLELHASTQMHIHNQEGLLFLKEMGIKRAVLARETPIEQIKALSALEIDLEVFVHGALCVSYSGQCLMSFRLFDRSGNRGACAQPCRMAYQMSHHDQGKTKKIPLEDEYLLSLKDMNTLEHIPELIEAGITSFKIEGRMKSPEYVAQTVKAYRTAIDAYQQKLPYQYDQEIEKNLQKTFNRGFTVGHLFETGNRQLVNMKRPNHMGITIGKVIQSTKDRVRIQLSDNLRQGDGIRIIQSPKDYGCMVNRMYDRFDKLINGAQAGDIIELDKNEYIVNGSMVIKSVDKQLNDQIERTLHDQKRKVPAYMHLNMTIGNVALLTIQDDQEHIVTMESEGVVETALRTPLDEARIKQQLAKSGDTIFDIQTIEVIQEKNSTIPIKNLNAMRRDGLEALCMQREIVHEQRSTGNYYRHPVVEGKSLTISIGVQSEEQLKAVKELGTFEIFTSNPDLHASHPDLHLIHARVHPDVYTLESDDAIGEVGGLHTGKAVVSELSMNVTNAYTAAFLHNHGVKQIMLSPELNHNEIDHLIKQYQALYGNKPNLGIMGYGRLELMITRYCAISAAISDGQRNCEVCRGTGFYQLTDKKGRVFPIITDASCYMHILDEQPINHLHDIEAYINSGITDIRIHFTIEDQATVKTVIIQFQSVIKQN